MTITTQGPRALADLSVGLILASVEIAAPPERVFRALSSPEVAEWWGSPDTYRVTGWSGEIRVGGWWRSEGVGADGTPFTVSGEVLEVDPPHRLVLTWRYANAPEETTTLTHRLDAIAGGTRLTIRHEGFRNAASCDGHSRGWERVLGWLTRWVAAAPPTLFEWAGGTRALERLTERFYERVSMDEQLSLVFGHMGPDHPRHVAHFIAEVLGGPATYSRERGGHPHMVSRHLGRHLTEAQRGRWMQLLLSTADEVGLPADPEFRSAFVAYIEWGSRLAVMNSGDGATVDPSAAMPNWGWGVPGGPYTP